MNPFLLIVFAAGLAAFAAFVTLERQDKGTHVAMGMLALLLVEGSVYSNFSEVPPSLFHPEVGGTSFRLYEVLIPMALLARFLAKGPPRALSATGLWWAAFLAWYATAAVTGILRGHDAQEVLFEAKAIIYIGGGFALMAGIPAREHVSQRGFLRLVRPFAVIAAILAVTDRADLHLNHPLPLLPLPEAEEMGTNVGRPGELGADVASLFVALGILAITVSVCRRRRFWALMASGPLLLSAAIAEQRAALIGLVVSGALLVAVFTTPTARRRLRATPTEAALVVLATVVLFLAPAVVSAAARRAPPSIPFTSDLIHTFEDQGKLQSAQARVNQWREARGLIGEHPVLGWGLGKAFYYFDPGRREVAETRIAHSIAVDLLIRTGLVGLVLFGIAVASSVKDGIRAWRYDGSDLEAALALACVALVIGLITKGLVESIFDNYRLATGLGMLLGMARSASTTHSSITEEPLVAKEKAWS